MAKEVSKVGLDASQFISEVAKMQKAINKYNNNLAGLASATDKIAMMMDKVSVASTETAKGYKNSSKLLGTLQSKILSTARKYTELNNVRKGGIITVNAETTAGRTVEVQLKKTAAGFKWVATTVNTSTIALKKHTEATRLLTAAKRSAQSALGAEISGARGRGQTNYLAKEQQRIMDRLLAQRKLEAELIRNSSVSLSAQLRIQQEILYAKIKSQARSEGGTMKGVLAENLKNMEKVRKKLTSVGKTNRGVVKEMVLSWKTFERVMLVHIIRRVFHRLIMILREALTAIVEFHKGIVEIRTIAQEHQASIKQWAESLTQLSNAYGVDLMDATNAYYQVLSNQVAKGVQNVERFTESVLRFAKVTRSTAEESVNLLTAAINAYGMESTQVERVAALMFKTIELGRIRVSDLANTFGRATVPAAQMGIKLEELNASIAAISIRGVKGTETMTLLRGIIMKLANPTTELKKLMDEWGFSSAEAMITAEGWLGVLKRIFSEAGDSMSKVASIFGRIRPAMGMAALISDLEKVENTMMQFGEVANRDYMSALQDQFQTSGEKFQLFTNQMKNFKKDIGEGIANFLTSITSKLDTVNVGLDGTTRRISGLTKVIKFFVNVGTTALTMLAIWATQKRIMNGIIGRYLLLQSAANDMSMTNVARMDAQTKATALLTKMVKSLVATLSVLAIVLAVTALVSYISKVRAATRALEDFIKQAELARLKARKMFDQPLIESTKELDEYTKKIGLAVAAVRASISKTIMPAKEITKFEKRVKDLHATMNDEIKHTGDLYKNIYKRLQDDIKETKKILEDNAKSIASLQEKIAESIFESEQRGRTPQQQSRKLKEVYKNIVKNFKQDLGAGILTGTEKGFEGALESIEKMHELIADIARIDQEIEQRHRQNREYRFPDKTPRSDINEQRNLEFIRGLTRELGIKDEQIHLVNLKKLKGRQQDLHDQFQEMAKTIANGNKEIQKKLQELDPFKNEAMQKAYDAFIAGVDITTEQLKKSINKWQEQFNRLSIIKQNAIDGLKALKITGNIQDEITKISKNRTKKIEDLTGKKATFIDDTQGALTLLETQLSQINRSLSVYRSITNIESLSVMSIQQQKIKELMDRLNRADPAQSTELIRNLNQELTILSGIIAEIPKNLSLTGQTFLQFSDFEKLEKVLLIIGKQQDIFNKLGRSSIGIKKLQEEIDKLTQKLSTNEKDSLQAALKSLETSFTDLKQKAVTEGLEPIEEHTDSLIEKMKALIALMNDFSNRPPPELTAPITKNQGGMIYANRGMFTPRGRDTVPAMLEPGEFVMNKRATSKFMEQVTPMNYGLEPNRFSRSQDVNVGDITVNISNPSGSSEVTARQIGEELRNEIRKGVFRF